MSNPAIAWVKEHPAIAGSVAAGVGLIVWLISRSGSSGTSSDVQSVANSQIQQASLANQNAATQAAAQVQEDSAAYAAQVANNQAAAALAASVSQNNAAVSAAQIAANVENTQTTTAGNVATTQINAELNAQNTQTAAEESSLASEFSYLTQANQATTSEVNELLPQLGTHTGDYSQTIGAIIAALEGQTQSSLGLSSLAEGTTVSNNQTTAAQTSAITNLFGSLFG